MLHSPLVPVLLFPPRVHTSPSLACLPGIQRTGALEQTKERDRVKKPVPFCFILFRDPAPVLRCRRHLWDDHTLIGFQLVLSDVIGREE